MESGDFVTKGKKENNQIKSKDIFNNLKNDYFLQKVFNNLEKRKILYISKYNKAIKKRINININDYKEYSELYSSIEIEIIPKIKKYENDKFININKEYENNYHIFFDDNKEEIKRNYIKEDDKIRKIKLIIEHKIKSFSYLFYKCKCIKSIYFKKFFRKNITNMSSMFTNCSLLKDLNIIILELIM